MIFKYVIANTQTNKCKIYNINASSEYEANSILVKTLLPFMDPNEDNEYDIADLESTLNDFEYDIYSLTEETTIE